MLLCNELGEFANLLDSLMHQRCDNPLLASHLLSAWIASLEPPEGFATMSPFLGSDDMLSKHGWGKNIFEQKTKVFRFVCQLLSRGDLSQTSEWNYSCSFELDCLNLATIPNLVLMSSSSFSSSDGYVRIVSQRGSEGGSAVVPWFIAMLNLASVPLSTLSGWQGVGCKWILNHAN